MAHDDEAVMRHVDLAVDNGAGNGADVVDYPTAAMRAGPPTGTTPAGVLSVARAIASLFDTDWLYQR